MIFSTLDSFYLSDEQLATSPSRQDGVDEATENQLRQFGCDLIQEAGILLRLPQAVMATGQVLLQRFYCKKSLRKLDVKVASMGAFWLAAKLEEVIEIDSPTKLRMRDVLSVFYRLIRRREGRPLDPLDPNSRKFEEMKAEVVRAERLMLRCFGFIVHVEQPHRFVLSYAHMLDWPAEAAQEAWNVTNDSLRTTLCVRYKAQVVACGILFLAARRLKMPMPENPPWWEVFEATQEQVHGVCAALLELYSRPKAEYIALGRDVTSRAHLPGMPSPKTTSVTPLRSPLPEPSGAASGPVTSAGREAVSIEAKASEGRGGSTVNGRAGSDGKAKSPLSATAGQAANGAGTTPSNAGEQQQQPGERPSKSGLQAQVDRPRSDSRGRSRSRSSSQGTGRKRSRSGDRREGGHKRRHHHHSRGESRDQRRDYDERDRRDSSKRSYRDDNRDKDRRREGPGGTSVSSVGLALAVGAAVTAARAVLLQAWPDFRAATDRSNQQALGPLQPLDLLWVSALPGVAEELLFRGALVPAIYPDW
ncbi:hypothetical protein N2152v2_001113 [Parachlorella kessleri]